VKEKVFFLNDSVNLGFILTVPVTGLCRIVLLQYKTKALSTKKGKCHVGREELDMFFRKYSYIVAEPI
jgi:hypothetical protein